ncbi:hypothetical protein N9B50_00420 [bacterium]|nr:hypothetical protein [bacterium]
MTPTTLTEKMQLTFTDEGFAAFLETLNEPEWLTEIRSAAWARFKELPWPSNRDEEWMRTDIRLFHLEKFFIPSARGEVATGAPVLADGVELAGSAASCDGVASGTSQLDSAMADKGVIFGTISELLEDHGDLIQKHLFQVVNGLADRFAALHQATWTSGTFLYVPRNVCVEKPIHTFSTMTDGGCDFSHTLIVLEEGGRSNRSR